MKPTIENIECGDRVTILVVAGLRLDGKHEWKEKTGTALFKGDRGWVLNMGGRHGIPGIAMEKNFVRVRKARRAKQTAN